MSKESALQMAGATTPVNPSLLAPQKAAETTESAPAPEAKLESDRFAHLAAKEANLQKQRELLKSDQQKAYEEKEKLRAVKTQIDEFQALQKKDPVAALKHIGFKEEDILNFLADKQPEELTPEQRAAQAAQLEVQKLRDELKAREDADLKARDDKAIAGYRNEIGNTITKEADKFKFLKHYDVVAQDLVYETILEIIKTENGQVNPHEVMKEALELVENHYLEDFNAKAKFMTPAQITEEAKAESTTKVPQRTRTVQFPVNPVDKAVQKPAPTLTSKATATIASSIPKPETKAQKRERLENMLRAGLVKK